MPHISWPVCDDCEGYGVHQSNKSIGREQGTVCTTCGGGGRTRPPGWAGTLYEPTGPGGAAEVTYRGTDYFQDHESVTLEEALKRTQEEDRRQATKTPPAGKR